MITKTEPALVEITLENPTVVETRCSTKTLKRWTELDKFGNTIQVATFLFSEDVARNLKL